MIVHNDTVGKISYINALGEIQVDNEDFGVGVDAWVDLPVEEVITKAFGCGVVYFDVLAPEPSEDQVRSNTIKSKIGPHYFFAHTYIYVWLCEVQLTSKLS